MKLRFEKTLKTAPREYRRTVWLGGDCKDGGTFLGRRNAIQADSRIQAETANALAALATVRKMTPADSEWLRAAEDGLLEAVNILHEADLRDSIGKYYDDIGEFDDAFRSFEAANNLLKTVIARDHHGARDGFIDDMVHTYSKDIIAAVGPGASSSDKPVFVLEMRVRYVFDRADTRLASLDLRRRGDGFFGTPYYVRANPYSAKGCSMRLPAVN